MAIDGYDRRKLRSQTPTVWTDVKAEVRRVSEEKGRRSDIEKESEERDPGGRTGRKVAKYCGFPMFCCSGGSRSRLAKAAGAGVMWSDGK